MKHNVEDVKCVHATPILLPLMAIAVSLILQGCSGYYGTSEYELEKQKHQSFADVIKEAGGEAERSGQQLAGIQAVGWSIRLPDAEITDELLETILVGRGSESIFELDFSGSSITDAQIGKLEDAKAFQKVFRLNLSNTAITDAGLDQIENVHILAELDLTGSKATKEGAKRLGKRKIASENTPRPFKTQPKVKI